MPALIPIGAAIVGGVIASKGAKSAANVSASASDRATDQIGAQYQQTRADQAPYREAGYTSLAQLSKGTADGGEFNHAFTMKDYLADPGYEFRRQQGEDSINRAAIAGGSRYSGATLKELTRYNIDQASQEFGSAYGRYQNDVTARFNRLASVANTGQVAVNQTADAGAVAAAGQAKTIQNAGNARASGYIGSANAINGTIGALTNNYQQSRYLSDMNRG